VCLTIDGDGVLRLGVGSFVGGSLVSKAVVGGAIGHKKKMINVFYTTRPLGAISAAVFPRQDQLHCRLGPPTAAVAVDVAVAVAVDNNNGNDGNDPFFPPCLPSLTAALLSASFHTASSDITPASSCCHCFAAIIASMLCCHCVAIVRNASNASNIASL
jgi:hypothetical protein